MNLRHERIVSFIGAGQIFDKTLAQNVSFSVGEYMSGGSIDRRLWDTPYHSITWDEKLVWAADICEGMRYIHSRGYTHRDLKSQNVLYDKESGRAKVADFGVSRAVDEDSATDVAMDQDLSAASPAGESLMTAFDVGTPEYLAPELCTNQVHVWERRKYVPKDVRDPTHKEAMASFQKFHGQRQQISYSGQQVDIYAFAIIMWEFISHQPPHRGMNQNETIESVHRGERPRVPSEHEAYAPDGWKALMIAAWDQDPDKRPAFSAIEASVVEMRSRQTRDSSNDSWTMVGHGDAEGLRRSDTARRQTTGGTIWGVFNSVQSAITLSPRHKAQDDWRRRRSLQEPLLEGVEL